jgi:hypothetical protein
MRSSTTTGCNSRAYFVPEKVLYVGGPAFYLTFNSLIMRVPLGAKPALVPILFPVESLYSRAHAVRGVSGAMAADRCM